MIVTNEFNYYEEKVSDEFTCKGDNNDCCYLKFPQL